MRVDKLIVVIRTSGERTLDACRRLLVRQINADAVEIVNERPFEAALRRSYEVGLRRNTKWMVTLDADVLLRPGAVLALRAHAEKMPDHFVQLEGLVHDKLTGRFRKAGHRIYRARHLEKALEALPPPGSEVRPEYATLRRMQEWGFPSREINLVVGIHDYEQFYADVYRKAFVHASKHQVWLGDMVTRWRQNASCDSDFRIALRGLCDGLMSSGVASIDTRKHSEAAAAALHDLGLREKEGLKEGFPVAPYVDSALREAGEAPSSISGIKAVLRRVSRLQAQVGTLRAFPFLVGAALCRVGTSLKSIATASQPLHSTGRRP